MTPKGPAPSTGQRQGAKEITELKSCEENKQGDTKGDDTQGLKQK